MKSKLTTVIGIIVSMMFMTATSATADENASRFSLGIGAYALTVETPSAYDDLDFYGGTLVFKGAISKHIAIRGGFFSVEDDDIPMLADYGVEVEVTGFDLQLLAGTNFYKGFNAFAGIGMFHENWEASKAITDNFTLSYDKDFTGAQLSFGLEYNWKRVGLEYVVNVRDTSDYEDYTNLDHDTAVSNSLALSYRF